MSSSLPIFEQLKQKPTNLSKRPQGSLNLEQNTTNKRPKQQQQVTNDVPQSSTSKSSITTIYSLFDRDENPNSTSQTQSTLLNKNSTTSNQPTPFSPGSNNSFKIDSSNDLLAMLSLPSGVNILYSDIESKRKQKDPIYEILDPYEESKRKDLVRKSLEALFRITNPEMTFELNPLMSNNTAAITSKTNYSINNTQGLSLDCMKGLKQLLLEGFQPNMLIPRIAFIFFALYLIYEYMEIANLVNIKKKYSLFENQSLCFFIRNQIHELVSSLLNGSLVNPLSIQLYGTTPLFAFANEATEKYRQQVIWESQNTVVLNFNEIDQLQQDISENLKSNVASIREKKHFTVASLCIFYDILNTYKMDQEALKIQQEITLKMALSKNKDLLNASINTSINRNSNTQKNIVRASDLDFVG